MKTTFYKIGNRNGGILSLKEGDVIEIQTNESVGLIYSVNGRNNHPAVEASPFGFFPAEWGWKKVSAVEDGVNNSYEIY